ncbi:MAG TPA: PAS domain-containing protein, partial [Hymenobacter sp.]
MSASHSPANGGSHSPASAPLLDRFEADTKALLHTTPWGVLGLAADGTVTILNPTAEALWGVPAAAVLGQAPTQV